MALSELKLLAFVIKGSQRRKMIKVMVGRITPSEIKRLTKLPLNSVSDNLRLFAKKGIAKCLNEKEKVGRIYVLTKKGEAIRKEFLSIEKKLNKINK